MTDESLVYKEGYPTVQPSETAIKTASVKLK